MQSCRSSPPALMIPMLGASGLTRFHPLTQPRPLCDVYQKERDWTTLNNHNCLQTYQADCRWAKGMSRYLLIITLDQPRRIQWHMSSYQPRQLFSHLRLSIYPTRLYPPHIPHFLNGCEQQFRYVSQTLNY